MLGSASVHAGIPPPLHLAPLGPGPPRAEHTGRYGQQAGGMRSTGMQFLLVMSVILFGWGGSPYRAPTPAPSV